MYTVHRGKHLKKMYKWNYVYSVQVEPVYSVYVEQNVLCKDAIMSRMYRWNNVNSVRVEQ